MLGFSVVVSALPKIYLHVWLRSKYGHYPQFHLKKPSFCNWSFNSQNRSSVIEKNLN